MLPILKEIQTIPLQPIMVITGPDAYLRHEMKKSLVARALGPQMPEMNYSQFQGGEDPMAKVLDSCRDYPAFAERRVIVLRDAGKVKKKEGGELIQYIESSQDSTVLILEGEKFDGRLDWVKKLKKVAPFIEAMELKIPEAHRWVEQIFREEKKSFEEGVPQALVEMMGANLGFLKNSVTQLCLYVGERGKVELRDVEALFIKISDENVFDVLDALFAGDRVQIHRRLDRLLSSGEAPLKILALLFRHLSILLALRFGRPGEVWQIFRMPPSFRGRYEGQVRSYGNRLHYGVLRPLTQADRDLKGSPKSKELILKNCVEDIGSLLAQ